MVYRVGSHARDETLVKWMGLKMGQFTGQVSGVVDGAAVLWLGQYYSMHVTDVV